MLRHRRLLKYLWSSARTDCDRVVRWMAENRGPRKTLNAIYNRFSYRQKSAFHARLAKLFRPTKRTRIQADGPWFFMAAR